MNSENKDIHEADDAASRTAAADEKRRQVEDLADTAIVKSEQLAKRGKQKVVEPQRHPVESKEQFLQRELASLLKLNPKAQKDGKED